MQPRMKLEIVFAEIIINNFYDMFWNIEKVQMAKLFPYLMAIFCHLINFSQSTRKCKIENFVQKHQHGRATKYYYILHNESSIQTLKPAPNRSQWQACPMDTQ